MLTFDGACWKFMGDHVVTNAHSLCEVEGARLPLPRRLGNSYFYDFVIHEKKRTQTFLSHTDKYSYPSISHEENLAMVNFVKNNIGGVTLKGGGDFRTFVLGVTDIGQG